MLRKRIYCRLFTAKRRNPQIRLDKGSSSMIGSKMVHYGQVAGGPIIGFECHAGILQAMMVDRAGFEPAYGKPGQIYSLLPLTTRPPVQVLPRDIPSRG